MEAVVQAQGKVLDQQEWDGASPMYRVVNYEGFLKAIGPELTNRVKDSGAELPVELGLTIGEDRWLVHAASAVSKYRIEADKLGRRHLSLSHPSAARLLLGHYGIDEAMERDGVEASTATAVEAARALFGERPVWRSPLDSATA